jgi:hypothetical protein
MTTSSDTVHVFISHATANAALAEALAGALGLRERCKFTPQPGPVYAPVYAPALPLLVASVGRTVIITPISW